MAILDPEWSDKYIDFTMNDDACFLCVSDVTYKSVKILDLLR